MATTAKTANNLNILKRQNECHCVVLKMAVCVIKLFSIKLSSIKFVPVFKHVSNTDVSVVKIRKQFFSVSIK